MGKLLGKSVPTDLNDILKDKKAAAAFRKHCASEYSDENFDFYMLSRKVKNAAGAQRIFDTFISPNSATEINVGAAARADALALMAGPAANRTMRAWTTIFSDLRTEVFAMMGSDILPRYLSGPTFNAYCTSRFSPTRVAKSAGVKTQPGIVLIEKAMIACATENYRAVQEYGVKLFQDEKETGFEIDPKAFTASMVTGKFKQKSKAASTAISRKNHDAYEGDVVVDDRKIKKLCGLLGIKKFRHGRTQTSVTNIATMVTNRKTTDANQEFVKVRRLEDNFADDMQWAEFLKVLKMAKIVK